MTHDRTLATLEEVASWPDAEDAVVLTLTTQYLSSHRDEDGFAWFSAAAQQRPERPLFLALSGLFRARMADEIPSLSRVAWVEGALTRLDTALKADPRLSRVVRALTFARLRARFGRQSAAVAELKWALNDASSPVVDESEPSTVRFGLLRACIESLSAAKSPSTEDAPMLATGWSVNEKTGFRFGRPRVFQGLSSSLHRCRAPPSSNRGRPPRR